MEQDILTKVPPELQKLVRLVARAFYQPEHFLVLDVLAKHPCVTEDDLYQLLRFEVKKLRVILAYLKKDKLIKNIQRIESIEIPSGDKKNVTVQYYYINYKVFVNVVKYKLDRMREKIQSEERKARNRTSYQCPNCQTSFTDLDVDRLMDPVEQVLKCTMCRSVLEEDEPEGNVVDARSLLSKLNDQLQPIMVLLKETENMNLAPEVLEPEPHGINKRILEASWRHGGQASKNTTDQWTTSKVDDIYGDRTVSVNFGTEEKAKQGKVAPQWMVESTVYAGDSRVGGDNTVAMDTNNKSNVPDDEIMALLVSEGKRKRDELGVLPTGSREPEESSSSEGESTSDDEMEDGMGMRLRHLEPPSLDEFGNESSNLSFGGTAENEDDDDDFESDEDELTMTVGDRVFQIADITPDLVAKMTPSEKQNYTELCQQAYNKIY